ncbi:MarR family transcriptional regulator [Hoyosella sp. G463]|uniref:MarR family transcriptional regulator n=1 Tax=Lolliginicoccus lacisalsi TaxID=2742202 RepID=A0A927JBJ1_9ACTN|nr:MarR family transcriptional regulator [Lolliginicoccus lacisalsi]MBD8506125.1 MarR family transcriptional regulator [Lolliginicoccus lacisalsi]
MDEADNHEAVLRFTEKLAILLSESGMPRMSARVFAYVLADDADTYTARDLAEGLRVSPAAISGAVRQLVQAGLLARGREPGERSDFYRIDDDDVWGTIMAQRKPFLERYIELLTEGAREIGATRAGGRRLEETIEFYRFMDEELGLTLERWKDRRARWVAGHS